MASSADSRLRAPNSSQQQQHANRRSIGGPTQSSSPRPRNTDAPKTGSSSTASPAATTPQPNAWSRAASAERSRSASAARTAGAPTAAAAPKAPRSSGTATPGEAYVAAGGFNREEVKDFLNKRRLEALAGDSDQASRWKAPSEAGGAAKQGGPWAQKPTVMSNGSDFWVQLKKQVTAKEQGMGG